MTSRFALGMYVRPSGFDCEGYEVCAVLEDNYYKLEGLKASYHGSELELFLDEVPNTRPTHYNNNTDILDFIENQNMSFSQGNVVKYVSRYKTKNGKDDLLKARDYIDLIINKEYPE